MVNPKKNINTARKIFHQEKKEAKKTFKITREEIDKRYNSRKEQIDKLFQAGSRQHQQAMRQATLQRRDDLDIAKQQMKKEKAVSEQAFSEQVNQTPTRYLKTKELKNYRLPKSRERYQTARERYKSAKRTEQYLTKEKNKTFVVQSSTFSTKSRAEQESNTFHERRQGSQSVNSRKPRTSFQTAKRNYIFKRQQDRDNSVRQEPAQSKFQYGQTKRDFMQRGTQTVSSRFAYEKPTAAQSLSFKGRIGARKDSHITYVKDDKSKSSSTFTYDKQDDKADNVTKTTRTTDRQNWTKSGRFFYGKSEKSAEFYEAKKEFKAAKSDYQAAQRSFKAKRPRTKLLRGARIFRNEMIDLASEDDTLQGARDIRDTARNTKRYSRYTYKVAKGITVGTKNTALFTKNRAVNLTERSRNLIKGNGFSLNDKNRHVVVRMKNFLSRASHNISRFAKKNWDFFRYFPSHVAKFMSTLIGWIWAIGFLIFLIFVGLLMGVAGSNLIQQDEFEVTKAYVHMTWEDSEHSIKSEDGTTYYTKIDDVMGFMNYKFQDYNVDDRMDWWNPLSQTYRGYLSDLWEKLNAEDGIKSMKDLYDVEPYTLTSDEQEELSEMKEDGLYFALQELDNPFEGQNDETVISMTSRFGYYDLDDKSSMQNHVIFEASQDQTIIAPNDGTVQVEGDNIIIINGSGKNESRLKFYGIADGSIASGTKVYGGEKLGKVKDGTGLKISYQKYDVDEKQLVYVNPAFYFPNVVQLQTTILSSIGQFQGDEVGRAKQVYDYLKSQGASNQFIAAVLGNWSVESSITAKRAEGDYLSPPVGATETSWDDENWLNIGGPTIYNGNYPNILHRGLGLGQWTDTVDGSVRNTLLRNYANSKNKKWYDLDLQLEFMFYGDSPYYTSWVEQHKSDSGSPAALAQLFLTYWEGNSGDKLIERQTRAVEWLFQIEKGFVNSVATGTAQVDVKALEQVREHLMDGVVPGGGDDMNYPWGQCTWGVAKRMNQLGLKLEGRDGSKIPIIATMGNGMDWVSTAERLGGQTGHIPKKGAIVSFDFGDEYGHVAIVEKVFDDGSFLISETNYNGSAYNPTGIYTFRTFSAAEANMSFAYTTK